MKTLFYTFYNRWGLCSRVVWELSVETYCNTSLCDRLDRYYVNGLRGVHGLLKKIEEEKYDYVLGLGDYRKDAKRIRIESKFINKYGRNKILADGEEWYSVDGKFCKKLVGTGLVPVQNRTTTRVVPTDVEMYIATTTSNGPCNRSAYLVSNLIKEKKLNAKFAFIHVPRGLDLEGVKCVIMNMIQNISTEPRFLDSVL